MILDTDNNAYVEYYKRLKARGNIPTDYMGSKHTHHFRLKKDTLRDDNDFVECTYEEHIELHRLMKLCYPCNKTNGAYQRIKGWYNPKGIPKSEEHKRKTSEAHIGTHHTEETKQKIGKAHKKSVKVIFNDNTEMIFNSRNECAEYLKVYGSDLGKYIKGKLKVPKRCNVKDIYYIYKEMI